VKEKLSEVEIHRRQQIIDRLWEEKLEREAYERRLAKEKSCHRGPGDPDWEFVK
jgi:hypothetical protein